MFRLIDNEDNDNKTDAKKEFEAKSPQWCEDKIKRDKDGKFASKNESGTDADNDTKKAEPTKNKQKDTDNDKRTIEERINQLPKHLQETGKKLYNPNIEPSYLIIKDDASYNTDDVVAYIDDDMVDNEKYSQLSECETLLNRFTENSNSARESNTFKRLKKDILELIENAPPIKQPYRVEYIIEGRDNFKIGNKVDFDIRSFTDFGAGKEIAKKIKNVMQEYSGDEANKFVIYVIDDDVNGLDISSLSSYPNQNECLINGIFEISEVEDDDEYNPLIVHLKKTK